MKKLFAIILIICAALYLWAIPQQAHAQPCQWRYSGGTEGQTATATYCGNVVVDGTITGYGIVNITSASTIAEMQALASPFANQTVNVSDSLRGGIFVYSSSACATPGVGDYGTQFPSTSGGTGCWLRQFSGPLYATWFGAVGDGTTNNATANQRAINALTSGQTLIWPKAASCYVNGSTLTVSGTYTRPVTLAGDACLSWNANGIGGISVSVSNVNIRDLQLTGNQNASQTIAEAAILVSGTFRAGLAPVNISNFKLYNLRLNNWGGYGIKLAYLTNFDVSNNTIYDIGYSGLETVSTLQGIVKGNLISDVAVAGTPGVTNAYGMDFSRLTDDAGELVSQPRSANIAVTNNVVRNVPAWECYDTHGGENIVFEGNVGNGCYYGVAIGPSKNSAGTPTYGALNIHAGGFALNSGKTDGTAGNGIAFQGAQGVEYSTGSIVGGTLINFGLSTDSTKGGAILIEQTLGLVVSGVSIRYPSPVGIVAYINNEALTITGVTCMDPWTNSASVGEVECIYSKGNANNITAVGNNFLQVGKSATYLLTTATGRAIRMSNAASGTLFVGDNNTNATTYVRNDGITANIGTVKLNGATPVAVTNAFVRESSTFKFGLNTVGGTVGAYPSVKTVTAGTGFTVAGTALDTSTYTYEISQ